MTNGAPWNELDVPPLGEWTPSLIATVVIPYFESEDALEITLAALAEQSYPAALIEVVIVDDGSEPPLSSPVWSGTAAISVVHQEDQGFGLARARNTGAAHAKGEIIVFLDCDMVPEPGWLEAHARWHHQVPHALTLGFRRHVDFAGVGAPAIAAAARDGSVGALFVERQQEQPEWIEFHMERTKELTSADDDLFRVVTGGNLGMRTETFRIAGGYDESFTQWGAEDTEFGYRAFISGSLLIPERTALCWHQGLGNVPDPDEAVSLEEQRAKIAHLIADQTFRRWAPGRSFRVPFAVVSVDAAGQSPAEVERCVESVLGNRFHDLVVELSVSDQTEQGELIRRKFAGDPRVTRPGDEGTRFCPLRIELPAGVTMSDRSIGRIVQLMRGVSSLSIPVPGSDAVVAAKTRYLRMSARAGQPPAARSATASWRDVGLKGARPGTVFNRALSRFREQTAVGKAIRRVRQVRSVGDLGALARWVYAGVRHRIGRRRHKPPMRSTMVSSDTSRGAQADGWIGAYRIVATEPSIFPGAAILNGDQLPAGRVDLILTGREVSSELRAEATDRGAGVVQVDSNAIGPVFDERAVNPIGFVPFPSRSGATAANEGPVRQWVDSLGVEIDSVDRSLLSALPPDDALRRLAFIVDHPGLHANSLARANQLVRWSAAGIPVVAFDVESLRGLISAPMVAALSLPEVERLADPTYRERISVEQRRAAHRDHSRSAALRRLFVATGRGVGPPSVTIVLATNRPDYLAHAFAQIQPQNYPDLETIVVFHGELGTAAADLAESVAERLLRADASMPFGEVLNMATRAATGQYVAKMDDDDWYGPNHILDLVLAREYSGADLIGKGAEFVYLASSDQTIRRFVGGAENNGRTLAGGCLLIKRDDLIENGGWRPISRSIDQALIEDVIRNGGSVYRTHGFEYVLNRHGEGHTWASHDRYFLDQADETWPGRNLEVAGIYSAG